MVEFLMKVILKDGNVMVIKIYDKFGGFKND